MSVCGATLGCKEEREHSKPPGYSLFVFFLTPKESLHWNSHPPTLAGRKRQRSWCVMSCGSKFALLCSDLSQKQWEGRQSLGVGCSCMILPYLSHCELKEPRSCPKYTPASSSPLGTTCQLNMPGTQCGAATLPSHLDVPFPACWWLFWLSAQGTLHCNRETTGKGGMPGYILYPWNTECWHMGPQHQGEGF